MLKANIISSENYVGDDLDKLNRSLLLLENAINGDKFKTAVLNFVSFQFVRYRCLLRVKIETIQDQEYSNDEIYNFLMKGHRQEGDDGFMDLQLALSENDGGSAVGATDGYDLTTTYRGAFNRMSEGELAARLTHEWVHTLGFKHSFSNMCDPTRDCLSVPYAIGNIVEILLTGNCWYDCKYESLNY